MKRRISLPDATLRSRLYSALIIGAADPWSTQNELWSQSIRLVEPHVHIVATGANDVPSDDSQPST